MIVAVAVSLDRVRKDSSGCRKVNGFTVQTEQHIWSMGIEKMVFDWFKSKVPKPKEEPQPQRENLALPLPDERPKKLLYPLLYRLTLEKSSSVVLKMGFCKSCKIEHKLLAVNHTSKLFDCPKHDCKNFLVKVN